MPGRSFLSLDQIQALHRILYPIGVYAVHFTKNNERYFAHSPAGEWRKLPIFTTYKESSYFYIAPERVPEAMDIFDRWTLSCQDCSELTRIICSYLFFCEIHPFADGNGTIALLIAEYMCFRQ